MKWFIIIATLSLMSQSLFAARVCHLMINVDTDMPQGIVETPASVIQLMKEKGYKARLRAYPSASAKNEYYVSPKVACGNSVFNPWLTKCETKVRMFDSSDSVVAEGVTTSAYSVGGYSGNVHDALRQLPDCKDL